MSKIILVAILSVFNLNLFAQAVIDTLPFQNSSHHWYDIFDKGNLINPKPDQPRYNPKELTAIADNILLYQKNNGGWPKNYDMRAILTEEQKAIILADKNSAHTTFDNSTTYSHVACLAQVYSITKDNKYKEASLKGLDFILAAQYANGGWPQFYPLMNDYSNDITYNDDVITGVMTLLNDIQLHKPGYSFIDEERLKKVKASFDKGLDCIIATQIKDNGKLTAWCQQYDEVTMQPSWARKFEPPSICNKESAELVLFLMSLDNPSKEVINAIQSAVKWFDESKITGIAIKTIAAPKITFKTRVSITDKIVVPDSTAPVQWARFYELGTHRPLFCNRDGVVVYTLAEVERERRDGYGWYVTAPKVVLKKYKEWWVKLALAENAL